MYVSAMQVSTTFVCKYTTYAYIYYACKHDAYQAVFCT